MPTLKYRDPADGLWKPVDGFIQPHPQAMISASAVLAATTAVVTAAPLDTVNYDTGGMTDGIWSLGSARLIAPMNGYYVITARTCWANNSTGYRAHVVRKNGTTAAAGGTIIHDFYMMAAPATVSIITSKSEPIYLLQGDYITLATVHTGGVSVDLGLGNGRYSSLNMEYAGLVGPNGVSGSSVTTLAATTDVQVAGKSVPRGLLGYAEITANTTINVVSATHVDIPGLSAAVSVDANRRVKITAQMHGISTVASDRVQVGISEGGTRLQSINGGQQVTASGTYSIMGYAVVSPTAGAHTYKLSIARLLGTGTVNASAGTTYPASILVEDVGSV